MKTSVFVLVSLLLLFNLFVISANVFNPDPNAEVAGSEDMQTFQNATNQIPIDDSGQLDKGKISGWKTNAEIRIDKINAWLASNASWLKVVFGMVPEISWLFALNLYVLLFFFTSIVLNGDSLWNFLSAGYARMFGLILFILGTVTKFFTKLAIYSYNLWSTIYNFVFSTYGLVTAIIIFVVMIAVLIFVIIYFPGLITVFGRYMAERKKKKEEQKEETDRKSLGALVKGIQEGSK